MLIFFPGFVYLMCGMRHLSVWVYPFLVRQSFILQSCWRSDIWTETRILLCVSFENTACFFGLSCGFSKIFIFFVYCIYSLYFNESYLKILGSKFCVWSDSRVDFNFSSQIVSMIYTVFLFLWIKIVKHPMTKCT